MRKRLITLMLSVVLLLVGCNHDIFTKIEADDFDIGYGDSLYTEFEVSDDMVEELVDAYNNLKVRGEVSEEVNHETSISVVFIKDDQLSGGIVIDDRGIFHVQEQMKTYQVGPNDSFYDKAVAIYKEVEKGY